MKPRTEVAVPLIFEKVKLECGCRADIVVENLVVIETKSIDTIAPIHLAQTLTYVCHKDDSLKMMHPYQKFQITNSK